VMETMANPNTNVQGLATTTYATLEKPGKRSLDAHAIALDGPGTSSVDTHVCTRQRAKKVRDGT